MPVGFFRACACALIALCAGFFSVADAQTVLLSEDHTIAAADQFVPAEHSFDITVPGKLNPATSVANSTTPSRR